MKRTYKDVVIKRNPKTWEETKRRILSQVDQRTGRYIQSHQHQENNDDKETGHVEEIGGERDRPSD